MKLHSGKLMRAKKTVALVSSCAISIDQAITVALDSIGGTVFDVKVKELDQQVVWRVKLLRDDERVKVYIDAGSGKIIQATTEPLRKIDPRSHDVCSV